MLLKIPLMKFQMEIETTLLNIHLLNNSIDHVKYLSIFIYQIIEYKRKINIIIKFKRKST